MTTISPSDIALPQTNSLDITEVMIRLTHGDAADT